MPDCFLARPSIFLETPLVVWSQPGNSLAQKHPLKTPNCHLKTPYGHELYQSSHLTVCKKVFFLQNFRVINYKLSKIVSGCAGATSNHNTMVYHQQQQHHQLCVTAVPESLLYRTSNSMWNLWTSNKERQSPMMLSLAKAVKICKQTRLFTSTDNLCLQLAENWKSNWHLFLDGIWSKHSNILNIKWKILKGWVMNSQVFWGHFGVDTFIM